MNDNNDFEQLDELLARPAPIADRGFSARVTQLAGRRRQTRRRLFLAAGLGWLLLILAAASPQAIVADIVSLAQSLEIGGFYPAALAYVQAALASPEQLPFTAIAVALLSLAAVASLAIRA